MTKEPAVRRNGKVYFSREAVRQIFNINDYDLRRLRRYGTLKPVVLSGHGQMYPARQIGGLIETVQLLKERQR